MPKSAKVSDCSHLVASPFCPELIDPLSGGCLNSMFYKKSCPQPEGWTMAMQFYNSDIYDSMLQVLLL